MGKRIAFSTLGCKLNQYETDSIASQFSRAGYEIVPYEAEADAYVVNTCTVTNKSDRKSRNIVNRATVRLGAAVGEERFPIASEDGRAADPPAAVGPLPAADSVDGAHGLAAARERPLVVVTGCFVDSGREELAARGDITYLIGNDRKNRIFDIVDAHFRGESVDAESLPGSRFEFAVAQRGFHTRSMVKIQDGCENFCTFCIIPFVRGRATSRPLASIHENVRQLIEQGTREVVLTGVNMGRYRDEGRDFADIVASILELPGDFRVRISSLEPEPLDGRFIELLGHPKMCPHLHLCLQSGSERILLAMRRMYTLAGYLEFVERIRARYPGFNLTTDIIVGFPGESEADFEATERVCREVGFSHIHTFKYSRRDGTRADRMPDQVAESLKSERSERIRRISIENKRRYRSALVGARQTLLVESFDRAGRGHGYGEHYVPIVVVADRPSSEGGGRIAENRFYPILVTGIEGDDEPILHGELVAGGA